MRHGLAGMRREGGNGGRPYEEWRGESGAHPTGGGSGRQHTDNQTKAHFACQQIRTGKIVIPLITKHLSATIPGPWPEPGPATVPGPWSEPGPATSHRGTVSTCHPSSLPNIRSTLTPQNRQHPQSNMWLIPIAVRTRLIRCAPGPFVRTAINFSLSRAHRTAFYARD